MMIMRAEKEILQKGSVDGKDMASAIQKESMDATSEIVRGVDNDGTLEGVSEEVGMLGRFTDITDVKRSIRGVIEKLTAVKLSKSSSDNVSKEDAEQVYQKELDGVTANLKEENSEGVLVQSGNGKTVYVSGQRRVGEPLEDELHNSAA